MSKFYVRSGSIRHVVETENANRAAMWVVDHVMQRVWESDVSGPQEACGASVSDAETNRLGHHIQVSLQGFEHPCEATFSTLEMVSKWTSMIATLERLDQLLSQAA